MIEADRLISCLRRAEEEVIDRAIRPKLLADYTGQIPSASRWRSSSRRRASVARRSITC